MQAFLVAETTSQVTNNVCVHVSTIQHVCCIYLWYRVSSILSNSGQHMRTIQVLISETGAVVNNTIASPSDQNSHQPNQGQRKMKCYYFEGEHHIKDCEKFTRDKAKYKLKTMDLTKKCKNKFRQAAKNGNIFVNEIACVPESTYLVEKAE